MKKFLLALGVIAMTFSVAACGGDDKKDNGGNNNGGNNSGDDNGSSSSSSDVASAVKKMCKQVNDCGGDGDACLEAFDPEDVPSGCNKKAAAYANCVAGKSCSTLQNAEDEDDICPDEFEAMSECGGGGFDDDDDDDDDWGDDDGDDDIDIDIDFE